MNTILVVHDTRSRRRALREALEGRAPWTVVECVAGELDEELGDNPPAVVVVEIAEGSGVDRRRLSGLLDTTSVPVVFTAVDVESSFVVDAWDRGGTYVAARALATSLAEAVQSAALAGEADPLDAYTNEHRLRFELPNTPSMLVVAAERIVRTTRGWLESSARFALRNAVCSMLRQLAFRGNLELEGDDESVRSAVANRVGRAPYKGRRLHVAMKTNEARFELVVGHEGPALADIDLSACADAFDEVKVGERGDAVRLVARRPQGLIESSPLAAAVVVATPEAARQETPMTPSLGVGGDDSAKGSTLADELVGNVLPEDSGRVYVPADETAGHPRGATEQPPTKHAARLDRDVTDLLDEAPRVDAFGEPLD